VDAVEPWDTSISFPPLWFHLPLVPGRDEEDVDVQVDARIVDEPSLGPVRQMLVDMLLGWARHGRQAGAAFGGMRWEDHPTFGVAMATFLAHRLEQDPQPVADGLAALRQLLAPPLAFDQFPPRLSEVDLPCGRALRLEAVRDPTSDATHPEALRLCVQYWIPVEASADLVHLDFSAANLALAHELSEEFAGIAASFSFTPVPP
jgi:hypothetical protein